LAFEPMEGRTLPSTLTLAPDVPPGTREIAPPPRSLATDPPLVIQNQGPASTSGASGPSGTTAVVQGSQYAVSDAWSGYWLVHSRNVAKVGLNFAKLTIAHNTRKVGGEYIKAVFKGDAHRIEQLNHTNAVKKVGQDFSKLSTSPGVKYVGAQFSHFGRSIADQYHKLFGGSSAPSYSKRSQID
jgi:hypothetical protein